jgi:hypothetical protein
MKRAIHNLQEVAEDKGKLEDIYGDCTQPCSREDADYKHVIISNFFRRNFTNNHLEDICNYAYR